MDKLCLNISIFLTFSQFSFELQNFSQHSKIYVLSKKNFTKFEFVELFWSKPQKTGHFRAFWMDLLTHLEIFHIPFKMLQKHKEKWNSKMYVQKSQLNCSSLRPFLEL